MTLGYRVNIDVGRVRTGEQDEIFLPRSPRAGRGVVLCHGSGNPHGFVDGINQPSSVKLAASLASIGIPCISGAFGGQAWGNDTVVSCIDSARTVLSQRVPSMKTDKVLLIGASMGGAAIAHYAQQHPDQVAGVIGLIPLWDLTSFYSANAGAVQAEISGAWGVATGAPLPTRANTLSRASLAVGIPHLCGYSSVDNVVLPPWSTTYSDAVGGTKIITDSTYGHSDAAIGGMPIPTVIKFLFANGA